VLIKLTGQTELAGGVLDPNGGMTARLKRAGIRLADGYQAISEEIRDRLLSVGMPENKVHHIGNAVDTTRFVNRPRNLAARESHCPGASFVMLFVGRLEKVKNLFTLLDAWAGALGTDRSAWLVLVGDGSVREDLERRAAELGIAERVLFLGEVPDVSALTNWADVGVLPSYTEGLSNAMLECLAAGLPMLASHVGGNPDFVRDGETGWLFEPTDRDHLTRLLTVVREMPVDDRAEMARSARKLIESEIALDAVGNRLATLLRCDASVEQRVRASGGRAKDLGRACETGFDPPKPI
jgi:glycosyltransferase involved in cell wall biosynthesis